MRWRRGLILAAIHLAVTVPLVLWTQSRDTQDLQVREQNVVPGPTTVPARMHAPVAAVPVQKAESVPIDPCANTVDYPPQETIARYAEMPAFILTGWRMDCPTSWSLSGRLHLLGWQPPSESSIAQQHQVDLYFCLLIAVQWFLIGSFPLAHPGDSLGEPGILITGCLVIACAMVFIPALSGLAQFPALIASFFWIWWLSLLVWTAFRAAWRRVMAKKPQAAREQG
jgi:hypothetical protein